MHRLAWLYMYGEWPVGDIDHINGIRDDNRLINLRSVSRQENLRNRRTGRNNTSGVMGVNWDKSLGKWRSSIGIGGKTKHLGVSHYKWDVICLRKSAEMKYGFHLNHGRN